MAIHLVTRKEGTCQKAYLFDGERYARVEHVAQGDPANWARLFGAEARSLGGGQYAVLDAVVTVQAAFGAPYGCDERWERAS